MNNLEIANLKKELQALHEINSDLKEELDEKTFHIGKLENASLPLQNSHQLHLMRESNSNETQYTKLSNDYLYSIQLLESRLAEASAQRIYLENTIKTLECQLTKNQQENHQLKSLLLGKDNFHWNVHKTTQLTFDIYQDYQQKVIEINSLNDQLYNVILENRKLREMANVPQNFGINIQEMKIKEHEQIEDYKAKIRIMQLEINDLEVNRALLKSKIIIMDSVMNNPNPPFSCLSPEHKAIVVEFAIQLFEGNEPYLISDRNELQNEIQKLKNQIEILERQRTSSIQQKKSEEDYLNEEIFSIEKEKTKTKQMMKSFADKLNTIDRALFTKVNPAPVDARKIQLGKLSFSPNQVIRRNTCNK